MTIAQYDILFINILIILCPAWKMFTCLYSCDRCKSSGGHEMF